MDHQLVQPAQQHSNGGFAGVVAVGCSHPRLVVVASDEPPAGYDGRVVVEDLLVGFDAELAVAVQRAVWVSLPL